MTGSKRSFPDVDMPQRIAEMLLPVFPAFHTQSFVNEVFADYESLGLMQKSQKIARTLRQHLPQDNVAAIEILVASFGPKLDTMDGWGAQSLLYLPHSFFIAEFGLDHFEIAMKAQYALTQRFTAEFSIRPFLRTHRDATLSRLKIWAKDPNVHVRRLVSEGTRPRLPWATYLHEFQSNPQPVLDLLEMLKDDPELYVRRSVANNLNDIGKDHPDLLLETAQRWIDGASKNRRWLICHALRSAVNVGNKNALAILNYSDDIRVSIINIDIAPRYVKMGDKISVSFDLVSTSNRLQQLHVSLHVVFIRANGKINRKVFKIKNLGLTPTQTVTLRKTIFLKSMTTRQYYPGTYKVEIALNGKTQLLGNFDLVAA